MKGGQVLNADISNADVSDADITRLMYSESRSTSGLRSIEGHRAALRTSSTMPHDRRECANLSSTILIKSFQKN